MAVCGRRRLGGRRAIDASFSATIGRPSWCLPVLLVLGSGCGGTRPPEITTPSDPGAPSPNVSYEFIVNEEADAAEVPENQELEAPRVIDAPLPEYPEQALVAGAPPTTVALRFLVRPDGTVGDVGLSPLEDSSPEPPAEAFWHAAETAVRRWSFVPGKIRMFKPGPDIDGDGISDYRIQTQSAAIGVYYHVRFRFEVVDGVGRVRMGADPGTREPLRPPGG